MMPYIVMYDDDMGICCPMTWDKDCDGALQAAMSRDPIATFHTRSDARRSIKVSQKRAELLEAQGFLANDDFLPPERKNIKIRRLGFPPRLRWNDTPEGVG